MKRINIGSSVVEACIVIPLFLLFMLYIIHIYRMFYVDAHIHQCLVEACVYYAERCYLEDKLVDNATDNNGDSDGTNIALAGTAVINVQLRKYMGEDQVASQVIAGGKNGIIVTVLPDKNNRKIFLAKASYMNMIKIPILGTFKVPRTVTVRQKAFLGYDRNEEGETDEYVYITPNEAVYHLSRDCSHLKRVVLERSGHTGYAACSFCVKENESGKVYITDNGEVYHNNPKCLGLKRTINRVKKSTVSGLMPCTRCGR